MAHSSLLDRLCSGRDPLPYRPPLRYAYPDYDLCDGQPHRVYEVRVLDDVVSIDHFGWKIELQWSGTTYLLSYDENAPYFLLDLGDTGPTLRLYDPRTWRRV